MNKEKFNETVDSLFQGIEGFMTSKTVVGDPIYVKDTIILPLPSAVLVIRDGQTKLVNVKNQETITKLLDMVPDVIDKFTKKEETLEDIVEDLENER